MCVRCDTRKHRNYPILTDIVFVRQDAKRDRAPRWHWIVDVFYQWQESFKGCQLTIQPAFENADSAFLFIQHCFIFVFFNFGRMFLPFFSSNLWQSWQRTSWTWQVHGRSLLERSSVQVTGTRLNMKIVSGKCGVKDEVQLMERASGHMRQRDLTGQAVEEEREEEG